MRWRLLLLLVLLLSRMQRSLLWIKLEILLRVLALALVVVLALALAVVLALALVVVHDLETGWVWRGVLLRWVLQGRYVVWVLLLLLLWTNSKTYFF